MGIFSRKKDVSEIQEEVEALELDEEAMGEGEIQLSHEAFMHFIQAQRWCNFSEKECIREGWVVFSYKIPEYHMKYFLEEIHKTKSSLIQIQRHNKKIIKTAKKIERYLRKIKLNNQREITARKITDYAKKIDENVSYLIEEIKIFSERDFCKIKPDARLSSVPKDQEFARGIRKEMIQINSKLFELRATLPKLYKTEEELRMLG